MKTLRFLFWALVLLVLQEFTVSEEADKPEEKENAADEPSTEDCSCDAVICEVVSEDKCPHGLVNDTRDPCRCCKRCGNGEYQFCDPEELSAKELAEKEHNFGLCGKGLTCRANYGVPVGAKPEMICYCQNEQMVCGSDGETYETECRMNKVAFETGQTIGRKKPGMCEGAPKVVTPPNSVTNSTVGNVYLQCEVKGNPVPRIEWRKIGPDGPADFIPSGDSGNNRVAIQTRGGPEEYEVTGWLQIMRLEVEDAGEYECVGINDNGEDSGRANIIVVEKAKPIPGAAK
ncbi:insulin-like growth factor-binding protein-related protein 1 [Acanthaster planci]|uniref:Insulin-like growth factor-binding protein-related protein 1 n=1 Tax=Acanthaster planci TaxID=133434 RepID=A0A8B7YH50_ACAPL|nr:insulin-like growth factor-binding protein-related protein 1 [Acanthaster planci]